MNRSESIKNLTSALVLAQKEAQNAKKTQKAVYGKYAPLPELIDENKPILSRHGLALIQPPISLNGKEVGIQNILIHESGEYLEFEPLMLTAEKMTPQGAGAAITYARRYSLSGILNISSEEDDDAQSFEKVKDVPTYPATASKTETVQAKPYADGNTQTTKATAAQVKEVFKLYKEKNPNSVTADYFAWVDGLYTDGKISSKFSSNKDKTEIYWTLADIITMQNEISLPF